MAKIRFSSCDHEWSGILSRLDGMVWYDWDSFGVAYVKLCDP
jgi:hypothetical protein